MLRRSAFWLRDSSGDTIVQERAAEEVRAVSRHDKFGGALESAIGAADRARTASHIVTQTVLVSVGSSAHSLHSIVFAREPST
jgi:hypothetical protein